MPKQMTNSTTATLMTTMVALNVALSLMPITRIAVMTSAMQKRRQVEADLDAEDVRRVHQVVRALHQFRRLGA